MATLGAALNTETSQDQVDGMVGAADADAVQVQDESPSSSPDIPLAVLRDLGMSYIAKPSTAKPLNTTAAENMPHPTSKESIVSSEQFPTMLVEAAAASGHVPHSTNDVPFWAHQTALQTTSGSPVIPNAGVGIATSTSNVGVDYDELAINHGIPEMLLMPDAHGIRQLAVQQSNGVWVKLLCPGCGPHSTSCLSDFLQHASRCGIGFHYQSSMAAVESCASRLALEERAEVEASVRDAELLLFN